MELARPLCFPVKIYHNWCKLHFGSSLVPNKLGGRLLIFRIFSAPLPSRRLLGHHSLLIFKEWWSSKFFSVAKWVFCLCKIFLSIRHFSQVTKSRIFKNLNLKKKADHKFRRTFLKNRFRRLKLYIPQADWLEVVVIWAPFERREIEVHFFERAILSGFGTWNFTAKEDLNQQKQVFLLNFRPWLTQKPKIGLFFMGNSLNKKIL